MTTKATLPLAGCQTLLLDMDGTLLDLAFDNFMWLSEVPTSFASKSRLAEREAREKLFALYHELKGTLDWYCLDHWSERLGLDVLALHRRHRDRIRYLPGAVGFLEGVACSSLRVLLVTNSHPDTLALKAEVTGLTQFFDGVHTAHDFERPKEDPEFWRALYDVESFDPESTLFVDDTASVLRGAADFGLSRLLQVTRPDSSGPIEAAPSFAAIESVAEIGAPKLCG